MEDISLTYYLDQLDEAHQRIGLHQPGIIQDVLESKYLQQNIPVPDNDWKGLCERVVSGVYAYETNTKHDEKKKAIAAMYAGLWAPGGRIIAGAGTGKRVTLMNCYVTGTIEDSMEGIMKEHTNFALTMQQGGGDGADFSPIRPAGSILTRTGTKASGPLPFMDMWNSMCTTIRSAGDRRGAMMATLADTHPDLIDYINAKKDGSRLRNFNLSILVSDAFMSAVAEDETWLLYFHIPPVHRDPRLEPLDFEDDDNVKQYVYSVWKARELWQLITETTYEYSEPGVIFIDQINEYNNLQYCETIRCTNPCGEQPLPPHGACDLGHINLARLVRNPFKSNAEFDYNLLREVARIGVRFLDNVIDVTNYPLDQQRQEQINKRRIGLGFTGLADAMAQMSLRYGSIQSAAFAERVTREIAFASYEASINLAEEKGAFKLFDATKYLSGTSFVARSLPEGMKERIRNVGIRNGVINTIAPVGTVSIAYGNVSSGIEPIFAHKTKRNVLQPDGSFKLYTELGYAARLFLNIFGDLDFPAWMVTAEDLTIHEHILISGRVQRWIDASISKTINIPTEMAYDDFVQVYTLAYTSGCKGCTTYRPSDVRGSILSKPDDISAKETAPEIAELPLRPNVLDGKTYKIKWPNRAAAHYLTINSDEHGKPFEILISSKDGSDSEWTTALSLMITAIFRKGGDVSFIAKELKQIQSLRDGAWINGQFVGSLPAYIGQLLADHITPKDTSKVGDKSEAETASDLIEPETANDVPKVVGSICKQCNQPTVYHVEGCKKCSSCGYSECG